MILKLLIFSFISSASASSMLYTKEDLKILEKTITTKNSFSMSKMFAPQKETLYGKKC